MGILSAAILVLLVLFPATPSTADIIPLKLRSDNRHLIPIMEFEFASAGYVSFAISSVSVTSSQQPAADPDPSRIGFFFVKPNQPESESQPSTICASDFRLMLFTFQDLSHYSSLFNKSYPVEDPGLHSLFFVNCNHQSIVSMEAHIELYNTFIDHANRTTKNYLSASLTQLPKFFSISSVIYLCLLGIWIIMLLMHHRSFHKMHLLMGWLLLISSLHAHCASTNLYYVKVWGAPPHGLQLLLYVFQFVRSVVLFTVIVLIGAGWCFWRPCLGRKENVILMVVILLQVWANVDSILDALRHYNIDRWLYLSVDSTVIDLMCWFLLFVTVACSFILLKEEEKEETSDTDGNAFRNAKKLCLFVNLVLHYLVFTRFVAVIDPEVLSGIHIYFTETSILVFCMVAFYTFRPFHEGDENKKAVEILQDDKSGVSSIV